MNKEKMNYEQRLLHVTVAAGILFSVIEVMMAIYTNSQEMCIRDRGERWLQWEAVIWRWLLRPPVHSPLL